MFLKRKIVSILQSSYHRKKGWTVTPEGLKNHILQKKWPRWNYAFWSKEEFENEVILALEDCIEGEDNYIGYTNETTKEFLKVTRQGRDFIGWDGFLEEWLKKRSKAVAFIFGGGVATIIGLIIYIFKLFTELL